MKIQISLSAYHSVDSVAASLENDGYVVIGEGNYGKVLSVPNHQDQVAKVSITEQSETLSYEWLKWCKRNANPYVPKVFSLSKRGTVFTAHMERLQPMTHDELAAFIEQNLNGVLVQSKIVPVRWDLRADAIDTVRDKHLRKLLVALLAFFKESALHRRHGLDITAENVMKRGNQVVFVDPIV